MVALLLRARVGTRAVSALRGRRALATHAVEHAAPTEAFPIDRGSPNASFRLRKQIFDDKESVNQPKHSIQRSRRREQAAFSHASSNDITIPGPDGEAGHAIPALLLRDACTCAACVDSSSKQRNFLSSDIPADISGNVVRHDAESVTIEWTNDIPSPGSEPHLTTIARADVQAWNTDTAVWDRMAWRASDFERETSDLTYDEYMHDDQAFHKVLKQLRQFGLAFIQGVPETEESVSKIAERIGPVKNTLYGFTWDVRSVPEALNVAYTSKDLGFHMDLLPMRQPPALQFLHCVRSSAKGGNSLFMDTLRAAQALHQQDPKAFDTLRQRKIRYHYAHPDTHIYRQHWSVLEGFSSTKRDGSLDIQNARHKVFWSPPFQAPLAESYCSVKGRRIPASADGEALIRWRNAAAKFNAIIHEPSGIVERLMKPGECVIFENTRVLHARTAFDVDDAGKERWLRGAYVDDDPWHSKMRVSIGKYGV